MFLWYLFTSFVKDKGTLKFQFNVRNHRNFRVNLPIVFIYLYFVKKKKNKKRVENLKNIV